MEAQIGGDRVADTTVAKISLADGVGQSLGIAKDTGHFQVMARFRHHGAGHRRQIQPRQPGGFLK